MPWQVNRQGATKCRLRCVSISCVPALLCALRASFHAPKGSLARLPPLWKGTVREGKSEGGGELYLLVLNCCPSEQAVSVRLCAHPLSLACRTKLLKNQVVPTTTFPRAWAHLSLWLCP